MYAHTWAADTVAGLLFSFLLRYDAHGNLIPDLAVAVPTLAQRRHQPRRQAHRRASAQRRRVGRRRAVDGGRLALHLSRRDEPGQRREDALRLGRHRVGERARSVTRSSFASSSRTSPCSASSRSAERPIRRCRHICSRSCPTSTGPRSTSSPLIERTLSAQGVESRHVADLRAESALLSRRAEAQGGRLESHSRRQHALQRARDARGRRLPERQPQRDRAPADDRRNHRRARPHRQLATSRHQHEPPAAAPTCAFAAPSPRRSTGAHRAHRFSFGSIRLAVSDIFPESWAAPALPHVSLRSGRRTASAGRRRLAARPRRRPAQRPAGDAPHDLRNDRASREHGIASADPVDAARRRHRRCRPKLSRAATCSR